MRCILMHKDVPVIELELDDSTGVILQTGEPETAAHLPVGTTSIDGKLCREKLNKWWSNRSIPASRSGLREALEKLQVAFSQTLLLKCYGLSLSDQYWIKPENASFSWKDINFFEHRFSEDVGDILLGGKPQNEKVNLLSPDSASDGWLKKRWKIIGDTRCLLKGGSRPFYQEPLNEQIASAVLRRLGIPHVSYTVMWDGNEPYSVCEDFITPQTELVNAAQICNIKPWDDQTDLYRHFCECCEILEIPGVSDSLDRMLVADYILANVDRHFGNFGAIRSADTLTFDSMAPLYDNGTSLWYNTMDFFINPEADVESSTFRGKLVQQIPLVTSFDWLDLSKLQGIDEECADILSVSPYISEQRREFLCGAVSRRVELLEDLILEQEKTFTFIQEQ